MEYLLTYPGLLVPVMVLGLSTVALFLLSPSASALWLSRHHVAASWLVRLTAWLGLEQIVYLTLVARKARRDAYLRLSKSIWASMDRKLYLGKFMDQSLWLPESRGEASPSSSSSHQGDAIRYTMPILSRTGEPPCLPKDPPPQNPSQDLLGVPKRQKDPFRALIEESRAAIMDLKEINLDLVGPSPRPRKPSTSSSRVSGPRRTRKPPTKAARPVRRRKKS